MFSNVFDQYLGKLTEFSREEAAALYQFAEEAAKKLGIERPIQLIRSNSKMPNLMAAWLQPDKSGVEKTAIIITDGARELFGSKTIQHHLSDELKAMVGHELNHIKEGKFIAYTARKIPVYGLPLAFAAGYYILDKAYRKTQHAEDKHLSLASAVKQVVIDEKLGLGRPPADDKETDPLKKKLQLYEQWLRYGGTIAAAATGLAAGLGVVRHLSMTSEFRADRMGALLSGSPDAQLSALTKLMRYMEEATQKQKFSSGFITTSPTVDSAIRNLYQRIESYFRQEMMLLDLEYTHAHPTVAQRGAALQALKKSPDFQTLVAKSISGIADNLTK